MTDLITLQAKVSTSYHLDTLQNLGASRHESGSPTGARLLGEGKVVRGKARKKIGSAYPSVPRKYFGAAGVGLRYP